MLLPLTELELSAGFGMFAKEFHDLHSFISIMYSELPTSRGDDLQSKCLLELYGLKLSELQRRVRSDVCSEYLLCVTSMHPDKQLFDWDMMKLHRPPYGVGDAFAVDFDDHLKKKRNTERLSKLEEEEKNRIETKKRKFFAEILNAARELQLQVQAAQKRRKQRNDGVQVHKLFLYSKFILLSGTQVEI
ncbi:hypothetical protein OSB04_031166 [Centaurea solstitialis]|uniref:Uncharacterized protein n=1 Tax=Centaurea solstitialis TaxID=347529 RepID=A0AA38SU64_9ASTR|nr:hypothetical protein OSB04_031166 [Centaurea solstitialis]